MRVEKWKIENALFIFTIKVREKENFPRKERQVERMVENKHHFGETQIQKERQSIQKKV